MNKKQQNTIIFILGVLAALGPFSIDMYLPGFPAIAKDLSTDISHVALSLTSYFVGIAAGQLIYGPLIDRFGRKKPLLFGLALYAVAAVGCALSPDIYWLIWLRLLLALGGCVGMVASRAIVRDIFAIEEIPRVFSVLLLIMGVAPVIAPTVGGFVTAEFGWRFIFYTLVGVSLLMLLGVYRFLPESRGADTSVSLKPKRVLKEYVTVLKNPAFITYSFASGLAMAGLFAYISGSPFVFMEKFGLTEAQYGWVFGSNAAGFILGSQLNRLILKRNTTTQVTLVAGWAQLLVGLCLIAGSLLGILGVFGTLVLIFAFLFCLGFINPNASALALAPFTRNAGSASAMLGSIQMATGALASGLVSSLHNGTALPMVAVMAAGTSISLVLLLTFRQYTRKNSVASSLGHATS